MRHLQWSRLGALFFFGACHKQMIFKHQKTLEKNSTRILCSAQIRKYSPESN
jgi:hypothetical protein